MQRRGREGGWMQDGGLDEELDGWMGRWMIGKADGWMEEGVHGGEVNGWSREEEREDGWTDGRREGGMQPKWF